MFRKICFIRTGAIILAIGLTHCLTATTACGDLVTFDFGLNGDSSINGLDLNGLSFATTSVHGNSFTVMMSASTGTSGIFQLNNSGLGINSPGNDRQDRFDNRNVANEWMDFSFWVSQPATITVVSVDLQDITGGDQASLIFTGGNTYSVNSSNVNGFDEFLLSELYATGQNISLLHAAGNGFQLQAITLDVQLIALPERSSPFVFAGGSFWFALNRRRRSKFCSGN